VAGLTDGGFGGFNQNWDSVFPLSNGTANLQSVYMFGYQAIHEMTVIGQAFTKNMFGMSNDEKLYTYYQGCSEGGREGWSQVQRYTDIDGAVIGAPAIRYAFQQVQVSVNPNKCPKINTSDAVFDHSIYSQILWSRRIIIIRLLAN